MTTSYRRLQDIIGTSGDVFEAAQIVTQSSDLTSVNSNTFYIIDGVIDMGTTSIEIPAGGFHFGGHNVDISKLFSSEDGFTLFTSPVGGSGDLFGDNVSIEISGLGSQVYDITDSDGNHAIGFYLINYDNCASLGTITNYRQGLESGTGRFGGIPSLVLDGTWSGGYRYTQSVVRALASGMTAPLFIAGDTFTMNSRFLCDVNCDLPTSASFADFTPSNFLQPSLMQMRGAILTRNGQAVSGDNNFFPNLNPEDLVCSWEGNEGLRNTFQGGLVTVTTQAATLITLSGEFVDIAGVLTSSGLSHFDSNVAGTLRNIGNNPIEFMLNADLTIEGTADNVIQIKVVKWDNTLSSFVDVFTQTRSINSLFGPRDVAFADISTPIILNKNDYVKLQVANTSGLGALTVEEGSFFSISRR